MNFFFHCLDFSFYLVEYMLVIFLPIHHCCSASITVSFLVRLLVCRTPIISFGFSVLKRFGQRYFAPHGCSIGHPIEVLAILLYGGKYFFAVSFILCNFASSNCI